MLQSMMFYCSIEPFASSCSANDLCYLLINRLPANSQGKDTSRCQKIPLCGQRDSPSNFAIKTNWKSRDQRRPMYRGDRKERLSKNGAVVKRQAPKAACNQKAGRRVQTKERVMHQQKPAASPSHAVFPHACFAPPAEKIHDPFGRSGTSSMGTSRPKTPLFPGLVYVCKSSMVFL